MKIVEKKKHGVTYAKVWYAEELCKKSGIIQYRSAKKPFGKNNKEFQTLVSSLELSEEEIVGKYTKNCRYEVRRAPREGILCECKVGAELTGQDISNFAEFFEEFWKSKGIPSESKEKYEAEIIEYASQDGFAIATAKKDGKVLVYHTYIVGEDFVRLYQSASHFRLEEDVPYAIIGMANRYLHKEDMLFFQKKGVRFYDWGGAGTGEDVASITKFKESFGGTPETFYDFEEVVGMKARILKTIITLIQKR